MGFSLKAIWFFSAKTFFGCNEPSQTVPHSCRKVLIVFWESFLKINRKPSFSLNFEKRSVQTTPRVEIDSHFFQWYRFTHVKMRAKKLGQKSKGAPEKPMKNSRTSVL